MSILTYIQKLLDENSLPSTLIEANETIPYKRLMIAIGTTSPNKNEVLELTAHPQTFKGAFTKDHLSDSYHLLQFQYVLPLQITPDTFNQVSSSLHFFNRLLHCPGFELDELSDQVVYRYVWFIKKKGIDAFLLMQVIGNVQLCFNLFTPYIKEIAEGKYRLEDILEKVTRLSKETLHTN